MTTVLTLVTNSNSEPIKQEDQEELTTYVDLVGYEDKYQISIEYP